MQSQNQSNNPFGETIYAYTRTQAIEDGELVDVSKMAKELGFRVPAAVTRSVWGQYIDHIIIARQEAYSFTEHGLL